MFPFMITILLVSVTVCDSCLVLFSSRQNRIIDLETWAILILFCFYLLIVYAGGNKQHHTDKNTAALDRETEELHHDRVTADVGRLIQQRRNELQMSQKDLAVVSRWLN